MREADLSPLLDDRFRKQRARVGAHLVVPFDEVLARRGGLGEPDFYTQARSQPVSLLPLWVAQMARMRGRAVADEAVLDIIESAVMGYFHVRVHDDWFDEGIGEPGAVMLLAEAFLVRHQFLLATTVGQDAAFWNLFHDVWLAYGEAMLLERALCRTGGWTVEQYRTVLARSHPLLLPGAAILAIAGLWECVPTLAAFVDEITLAAQLWNDLRDIGRDRQRGQRGYLVDRFGGQGAGWRILVEGGYDEVIAEANQALDRASAAATELGMPSAQAGIRARRKAMEKERRACFAALFDRLSGATA